MMVPAPIVRKHNSVAYPVSRQHADSRPSTQENKNDEGLEEDAMVTERRDTSSVYNETANSNAQAVGLQTSMQAYTAAQA